MGSHFSPDLVVKLVQEEALSSGESHHRRPSLFPIVMNKAVTSLIIITAPLKDGLVLFMCGAATSKPAPVANDRLRRELFLTLCQLFGIFVLSALFSIKPF